MNLAHLIFLNCYPLSPSECVSCDALLFSEVLKLGEGFILLDVGSATGTTHVVLLISILRIVARRVSEHGDDQVSARFHPDMGEKTDQKTLRQDLFAR